MSLPIYRLQKISHIYCFCCCYCRSLFWAKGMHTRPHAFSCGSVRARALARACRHTYIFETFPFHALHTRNIRFYSCERMRYSPLRAAAFWFFANKLHIHHFDDIYGSRCVCVHTQRCGLLTGIRMRSHRILLRYFHIKCVINSVENLNSATPRRKCARESECERT